MGYLRIDNVSKAYKRYSNGWHRLLEWLSFGKINLHRTNWVLRDINYIIEPGEAIGIIGQNGAGKSTLLKIITGTTKPTIGNLEVGGRVAALLELGMGFHPEFTGRQNVFMAGQLLGYSTKEIEINFHAIEAFADIGEYIDQPVRTYSSGMQVRLAFSVATAIRPDILIVDEALSVGDIYFQQKCFERINSYVKQGTTLLFVSHSPETILNLCTRAILLRNGELVFSGSPKEVVDLYQADLIVKRDDAPNQLKVINPESRDSVKLNPSVGSIITEDVECININLKDQIGNVTNTLISDSDAVLEIVYRVKRSLTDPHIGFKIRNKLGVVLFETNTYCMGHTISSLEAGSEIMARFSLKLNIAPGEYTVTTCFANHGYSQGLFKDSLNYMHEVLAFSVARNHRAIQWSGVINLAPTLEIQRMVTI